MREKVNLKVKRNIAVSCLAVCIIVLIIILARTKTDTKIASKQVEEVKAITISAGTKNSNNYTDVESEDGILVPVPKGYVASPDVEERYVNGVTTDGVREHHGGFVIYEKNSGETDEQATTAIVSNLNTAKMGRNQWVWVPISSVEVSNMYHVSNGQIYGNQYNFNSSNYSLVTNLIKEPTTLLDKTYNRQDRDNVLLKNYLEGISANEFLQEMRVEFFEMLESIKTYGRFYIGRYETGNVLSKVPVVRKGNSQLCQWDRVMSNWYNMYKNCKNLKGINKVIQTEMIWGIQWDETLKWLIDSGEKTYQEVGTDSTSWGNYINSSVSGHGSKRPSGYSEVWKANNIYDLAGNVGEWTMSKEVQDGGYRNSRGGAYNDRGMWEPVAGIDASEQTQEGSNYIGYRATLYIL